MKYIKDLKEGDRVFGGLTDIALFNCLRRFARQERLAARCKALESSNKK